MPIKRCAIALYDLTALLVMAFVASFAFTQVAWAYVDPSVMTYTIQALAGVVVALSAVAGLVLSILGLNNAKKLPGNKGHGLALAGTIISAIRIVLILIGLVALIGLMFRGVGHVGHEIITNWQDYVPYYH